MTKRNIIVIVVAIIVTIALMQPTVVSNLLLFLLVGAVPGTNFSIPAWGMLLLLLLSLLALTQWVASRQLYPGSPKAKKAKSQALRATARRRATRPQTAVIKRRRFHHADVS
ncbi:MAG TPA: hypothetical protein VFZ48_04010 [Candidatus Saccharimonadales bacterium]